MSGLYCPGLSAGGSHREAAHVEGGGGVGGLFRARQTVLYGEKQEERNRARKMLLPGDEERSIADGSKLHSKSDVSEMD